MSISKNNAAVIIVISVFMLTIICLTVRRLLSHKILRVDADKIGSIKIFSGDTGKIIIISDDNQIKRIINNLHSVSFKKDSFVQDIDGFNYYVDLFGAEDDLLEEFVIDSEKSLRYKGYLYTAKDSEIDVHYIKNLFELYKEQNNLR